MITENTSPFCLSPVPLGTEMGYGAQSWFLGEGQSPQCRGTSSKLSAAHEGLRGQDNAGQADLLSPPRWVASASIRDQNKATGDHRNRTGNRA